MLIDIKVTKRNKEMRLVIYNNQIIIKGRTIKAIPQSTDDLINIIKYEFKNPRVMIFSDGFSIKADNGFFRYFE
jgi:hypothetical protein